MAITSSSATFARFYVPDEVKDDFWTYVDEKLNAGCFTEAEDDQEQVQGFTSWEDLFEPSFAYGSYHKGEYAAFNFRLDQRKVPAIVQKKYVRDAIQKHRDQNEGKWPSREERIDIEDNVKSWLLSRALMLPSVCQVVWNTAQKWMFLGTTSTKMLDAFLNHFEEHFKLYPVPLYHVHWALNLLPLDGRQKDILTSMVSPQSAFAMEEGRFLGHEFLTWLWFFSEQGNGSIEADGKVAEIHPGERLVLTKPGEGKEKVTCTTQANSLYEARTALQQGKLVHEIQLFIMVGDNEYTFTLDSSLWAVKGLKSPKQMNDLDEDDPDGIFLEKMFFLEEVSSVLNALFTRFLTDRLEPRWESQVLPQMREWMAGEAKAESEDERTKGDEDERAPF